jgi:hypothetical protein
MCRATRVLFALTMLLLVAAGPLVTEAVAASTLITYAYTGSITSTENVPGVVVGDAISGTFSYDSSQSGNNTTGQFTFTGSTKGHTLTLAIFNNKGQQVFTDKYSGNVSAYYFAQVSYVNSSLTTINLEGDTVYKQGLGVTHQNGDTAFNLKLSDTTGAGGFTPTNQPLPTTTTIKDFVSNTGTLSWDPAGQAFTANITNFIDLSAPEPSSWVLGVIALVIGTAFTVISRRKATSHATNCRAAA